MENKCPECEETLRLSEMFIVIVEEFWNDNDFEKALSSELNRIRDTIDKWYKALAKGEYYDGGNEYYGGFKFGEKLDQNHFLAKVKIPLGFTNHKARLKYLGTALKRSRRDSRAWYKKYKESGEASPYNEPREFDYVCLYCGDVFDKKDLGDKHQKEHK